MMAEVEKDKVDFGGELGTLEFGVKEKVKKQSRVGEDGTVHIVFAFRNGEVGRLDMAPDHPLFARAAQHGLDQKLGDEFSGMDDPDDCAEAFRELAKRINEGTWNQARQSDGLAGLSILAKALVRISGKEIDEVRELLKGLTAAQKSALRKDAAVAKVIREIEDEREAKKPSSKKVDTGAILAAFTQ